MKFVNVFFCSNGQLPIGQYLHSIISLRLANSLGSGHYVRSLTQDRGISMKISRFDVCGTYPRNSTESSTFFICGNSMEIPQSHAGLLGYSHILPMLYIDNHQLPRRDVQPIKSKSLYYQSIYNVIENSRNLTCN